MRSRSAHRYSLLVLASLFASIVASHTYAAEPARIEIIDRDTSITTKTASAQVATIEVHDVSSRGEWTRLRVETVPNPIAIAVLFAGGKGAMRMTESGAIGWGNGNFLIRSRPLFHSNGLSTVVFDAPTDEPYDLRHGFRGSSKHAADISAVIVHLRKTFDLPVWLVGTSRGTNSVASAAVKLKTNRPDGIVLTASMLEPNEKGDHLFDFALEKITMPVLIAHHEDDECFVTPPGEVAQLAAHLINAQPLGMFLYSGGIAFGNPCQAAHYHGFNDIEERVVRDIADWIKAQSP